MWVGEQAGGSETDLAYPKVKNENDDKQYETGGINISRVNASVLEAKTVRNSGGELPGEMSCS